MSLTLKSLHSNFELTLAALVIQSITTAIPTVHIDMTKWQHLANLELADPQFGIPGNIDVLIGADVWGQVVEGDIKLGGLHEPHAQRSRFGWVVFGPASAEQTSALPSLAFSAHEERTCRCRGSYALFGS